jgi:hypothetical protein
VHPGYHEALVGAGLESLGRRLLAADEDGLGGVRVERVGHFLYVWATGKYVDDAYLARIDLSGYPVEPYEIGFLDPAAARSEWDRLTDRDPRFWPLSGIPGLHGSFHVAFPGVIPVFWCERATAPFYHYHGAKESWVPRDWPVDAVVVKLVQALKKADHPRHWRPVGREQLFAEARKRGIDLPADAGVNRG